MFEGNCQVFVDLVASRNAMDWFRLDLAVEDELGNEGSYYFIRDASGTSPAAGEVDEVVVGGDLSEGTGTE